MPEVELLALLAIRGGEATPQLFWDRLRRALQPFELDSGDASEMRLGFFHPVLTVAVDLVGFSVPTLLQGSGFLAVYLAGHGSRRRQAAVPHGATQGP